jgi:hypothetical protein
MRARTAPATASRAFGWPACSRCRAEALSNWSGRRVGASRGIPLTPARYWVRYKGTQGLMRHLCAKCTKATGDHIHADLGKPR